MDYKTPDEIIDLSFNYKANLAAGETILAAEITAHVKTGEDETPESTLSGLPTITGPVVYQRIQNGIAGNKYAYQCLVDTSTGRRLELVGVLPVRALV